MKIISIRILEKEEAALKRMNELTGHKTSYLVRAGLNRLLKEVEEKFASEQAKEKKNDYFII